MIEYSAIAESSAVILTIYFLFFPITLSLSSKNLNYLPLPIVRLHLLINFLLFGITIILAIIENFYSFVFLIISLIFLPFSINYLLKFFESSLKITESLKGKL